MFGLAGLSGITLTRAIRRRGGVFWRVTVIVSLALAMFLIDVKYWRCQYVIGIATTEYWAKGGPSEVYYNWWWFNDQKCKPFVRWLRGKTG